MSHTLIFFSLAISIWAGPCWGASGSTATDPTSDQNGFDYKLALQELEEQVALGNIPPEAVAEILDRIAPILNRVDPTSGAATGSELTNTPVGARNVKITIQSQSSGASSAANSPTTALPKIPTAFAGGSGSSSSSQNLVASGSVPQIIPLLGGSANLPPAKKFQELAGVIEAAPAPKTVTRPVTAISTLPGSGGASGETSPDVAPARTPEMTSGESFHALENFQPAAQNTVGPSNVFGSVTTADRSGATLPIRAVASAGPTPAPGASALDVPKLRAEALNIAAPVRAETGVLESGDFFPGDGTSWFFGTLITLLGLRAVVRWRRWNAWRKQL